MCDTPCVHMRGWRHEAWTDSDTIQRQVGVVAQQCSAFARGGEPAALAPSLQLLACGPAVTPATAALLLVRHRPDHVMLASWWFSHPVMRSVPDTWLPLVRDLLPAVPVTMLVDDMFEPFPYSYNSTVDSGAVALVATCGAQTIALAASDGVATLTREDSLALRRLLPSSPIPLTRARYVTARPGVESACAAAVEGARQFDAKAKGASGSRGAASAGATGGAVESDGEALDAGAADTLSCPCGGSGGSRGDRGYEARATSKEMAYIGSCHAANEAALRLVVVMAPLDRFRACVSARVPGSCLDTNILPRGLANDVMRTRTPRWLLAEALPALNQMLGSEADTYSLHIIGNVTPQTCAPSICAGGVCAQGPGRIRLVFRVSLFKNKTLVLPAATASPVVVSLPAVPQASRQAARARAHACTHRDTWPTWERRWIQHWCC